MFYDPEEVRRAELERFSAGKTINLRREADVATPPVATQDFLQQFSACLDRIAMDQHGGAALAFRDENPVLVQQMKDFLLTVRKKTPQPPVPSVEMTECIQIAVFDNWGKNTRPAKPGSPICRYGIELNSWVSGTPVDFATRNCVNHLVGDLMTADQLRASADHLVRTEGRKAVANPITKEFHKEIIRVVDADQFKGHLFCLLKDKTFGSGTRYMDGHVLVFEQTSEKPFALSGGWLFTTGELRQIAAFVTKSPDGKKLIGKAILQSRTSTKSQFHGWITSSVE
jgi:hypothetical protein